MNIKYFGIGRSTDSIFLKVLLNKESKATLFTESKKVFEHIKKMELSPEERQKIGTGSGNWYVKQDEHGFIYLGTIINKVCVNFEYPERHAYGLFTIIQENLNKIDNFQTKPDSDLKTQLKKVASETCKKYEDLKSFDKVHQAQANVEVVRIKMEDNVKKMLDNQPKLNVVFILYRI